MVRGQRNDTYGIVEATLPWHRPPTAIVPGQPLNHLENVGPQSPHTMRQYMQNTSLLASLT